MNNTRTTTGIGSTSPERELGTKPVPGPATSNQTPRLESGMSPPRRPAGFTLVEVLVVIAIVALLTAMLVPSLTRGREAARHAICLSNIRQLIAAVQLYAGDNDGRAAPGAPDFRANMTRWHGARARLNEPFLPAGGPLTPYLSGGTASSAGASRHIRECPSFAGTLARLSECGRGFERSAGGYGYNNAYIGVELLRAGEGRWRVLDDRTGANLARFAQPDATVTFSDTAFPDKLAPDRVVEYSFAEPRFHRDYADSRMDPSVHFRHASRAASVAWLDGHANSQKLSLTWSSGLYDPSAAEVGLGWFGDDDANTLFDFDVGGG